MRPNGILLFRSAPRPRAGAEVLPIDAGMLTEVPGMRSIKVARGTRDLSRVPAMTRRECLSVLLSGMDLAAELADKGYTLLAAGASLRPRRCPRPGPCPVSAGG